MKYVLLGFALLSSGFGLISNAPSRRTFLAQSVSIPVALISTSAFADDEPSLFEMDIFDPKAPSSQKAAPKKIDPLRTTKPSAPRASREVASKEDPYSTDAIAKKRAKAAGLWGGGGKKKGAGTTFMEQTKGKK
ncbi:hypothetical protein TrLO_g144 [Triparma laevis f. longispina]|uniref:Uncharacterized protein n=1 Tax=Triparma laevis f. longispina TaxID=1714387 RepID=A0A9W7F3C1_9STRA|nr:hypothetical protein TrLO_g144 [Triparma laevis f. longispina]